MVTALAGVADDITICTLTAKTIVYNALMVITGAATNLTSLTGAVGRTGALYIDWLVAQSMKAAANTVYGDAAAELGTGLNVVYGDLASWTSTTAIKAHFISGVENLSTILTFGLDVYLETAILT